MREELIQALMVKVPARLATELVDDFLGIRRDIAVSIPGRATPGKFVESVVQALQFIGTGAYDEHPAVDRALQSIENLKGLDDGLRICGARIARSMYTLRNKRGIAHKSDVDPNEYDLLFLHSAAQWVMAEMVRVVAGCTLAEANHLVRQIRAPAGGLVEDFGTRKLVLAQLPLREEILVLLHSEYPKAIGQRQMAESLDRSSTRAVMTAVKSAWRQRLIEGTPEGGYTLTRTGLREATAILVGLAM